MLTNQIQAGHATLKLEPQVYNRQLAVAVKHQPCDLVLEGGAIGKEIV